MQVAFKTQDVSTHVRKINKNVRVHKVRRVTCFAKLKSSTSSNNSNTVTKLSISSSSPKPYYPKIGFTRANEILHGRMAMVGFFASVIGDYVDKGVGPLELASIETGLSNSQIIDLVGFITLINVIIASLPNSATFHREELEQLEQDIGPLQDGRITIFDPLRFFGVDNKFGFYTKNELFVGRVAMIGFAISVAQDLLNGEGPLTELSGEIHVNAMYIASGIVAWAMLMATTAISNSNSKSRK